MQGKKTHTPDNLRRATLLLAVLLVAAVAVRAERLPLKIYTTADGLPHNSVNKIVRDSRGFLWFCTDEGLSRFDGYGFTNYGLDHGLPSAIVNDLLETRKGEYWVATANGVARFDPSGVPRPYRTQAETHAMFTTYFPADADVKGKYANALLEDRPGAIWCATERGLYRIESAGAQVALTFVDLGIPDYLESRIIYSLLEDRRGALWVGTASGLYRRHVDGRVDTFTAREGMLKMPVHALFEDGEGRVWVGARGQGLFRLKSDATPGRPSVASTYTKKDGLTTGWFNQFFQDSKGRLWAGSNRGLIQFLPTEDGRDFRFRVYSKAHGLTYYEVYSIAEDRDGNLWLGTQNGGALKVARSGFTAYGAEDGLAWSTALYENRAGELFVAGSRDAAKFLFNRFDGEKFTPTDINSPGTWGWSQLMLETGDGEWWIATRRGLYRYPKVSSFEEIARTRPKAIYTTRDGLASDVILRIFEDSRGDIWVGSVGEGKSLSGLSRWERSTNSFHHYAIQDGLPDPAKFFVSSFAEDRAGHVWIGYSAGGGLVRYREGHFEQFNTAEGLPAGSIRNLFVDSAGRLWIPTTRSGLVRVDDASAVVPAFAVYSTANGLASNHIMCVTEDYWGRIYAGTGRGVDRIDPDTGRVRHYTSADGLLIGELLSALRDGRGTLWFSYPSGLVSFTPEPDPPPQAPPIMISGLRVADTPRAVSAMGEADITLSDLAPDNNQLQIAFVGISFAPGETLRYQYKLEGSGSDWSIPVEQRTVNLANLAPGKYRFIVRAINSDGIASLVPAAVSFAVLRPVWQRWWFLTLACLTVGLAIYALYRYRVARLLEIVNMRTRIASDLHDDIGAGLSRIAVLSEVTRHEAGHGAPVADRLSTIAQASRELVDSMSDIVWVVNPGKDQLSDLTQRMRRFASDAFTVRGIELKFIAPADEQNLKVGADVRRHVFLIFKEAVNNIIRHSDCTEAGVEMRIEQGSVVLVVKDNGRGFDPSVDAAGNGLANMRARARVVGGQLEIDSELRRGTTITLLVPLKATVVERNGRLRRSKL